MKQYLLISLFLGLWLSACKVTVKTEDITPATIRPRAYSQVVDGTVSGGVVYALPNTVLHFTVIAEKVEKKRGEFYLYSERYLGLKDVILEDAVEWHIKGLELELRGEANPDEMFQLFVPEGAPAPRLSLSEEGLLLGVNTPVASQVNDAVLCSEEHKSELPVPYTEEMLLANSSAKMAQEAARYIYRLRESRTALLSSTLDALPPDGEAYAMSLAEIDRLEERFLELFKGKETRTCVRESIDITPTELIDKEVLFRFSSFNGLVPADDLSGAPFFITMEKGDFSDLKTAPLDTVGLYYKRPAPVVVNVFDGNKKVLSEQVMMSQFGDLQMLDRNLLDDDVQVQFYPATGAIKAFQK